jgi:hypothetical protein
MIELYKALHEARKAFSTVKKNSTNPHFKSKYADLESILDATEKSLDEKGLLVVTVIKNDNVETSLIHVETGQSIISYYPLNTSLTDQQKGSAITYGRRYNMQSMLNLVAEDDDGNDASKKPEPRKTEPKPDFDPIKTGESSQKFISETEDYGRLEAGLAKLKAMESMFKRTNTMDIYTETVGLFNAKIKQVKPHE